MTKKTRKVTPTVIMNQMMIQTNHQKGKAVSGERADGKHVCFCFILFLFFFFVFGLYFFFFFFCVAKQSCVRQITMENS